MSVRRSMFRGSELPRLLILAAIVVAGWPLVLLIARTSDRPQPIPPAPVAAAVVAPVHPDTSLEFQALVDKAPMQGRENAAYSILLERARRVSAEKLSQVSCRDILFTHLWERPASYRGVPIHIEGTALRVLSYEVNPALSPSGRIFEAWVYSDENRAFPYVVTLDQPPPGLVVGPDLHLRVRFDGYFLKLLGYRAGDKWRAAPLLVGRLALTPAPVASPPPMVEVREFFRRHAVASLLALLFGYLLLRAFFQARRLLGSGHHAPLPSDRGQGIERSEIAPDDLARWLADLPQGEDDPLPPQP